MALVAEGRQKGARLSALCDLLGLSPRTVQRYLSAPPDLGAEDGRKAAQARRGFRATGSLPTRKRRLCPRSTSRVSPPSLRPRLFPCWPTKASISPRNPPFTGFSGNGDSWLAGGAPGSPPTGVQPLFVPRLPTRSEHGISPTCPRRSRGSFSISTSSWISTAGRSSDGRSGPANPPTMRRTPSKRPCFGRPREATRLGSSCIRTMAPR